MGSSLPLKISYWTGWLHPHMEGISKEVFSLAQNFPSFVFGMGKFYNFRFSIKERYFGLNFRFYYIFKILSFIIERFFCISHIYDDLASWFYLKNLGKRPLLLTAVTGNTPLSLSFYERVRYIIVDTEERKRKLEKYFHGSFIKIIYPGLNLSHFYPSNNPPNIREFKVLFASAPITSNELLTRGVWQILDAASLLPEIKFTLIWRPWGNSFSVVYHKIKEKGLSNVNLINLLISDMRPYYHNHHVILAPFLSGGGKPCPTSVLEGIACGLPAIIGEGVSLPDIFLEKKIAVKIGKDPQDLANAIKNLQNSWHEMHALSRKLAEKYLDFRIFLANYSKIYETISKV